MSVRGEGDVASVSNNIDKARAAAEALEAAYDACVAADVTFACESLRRERDDRDAVAVLVELAVKHVASLERRAMPIAIGDHVTIHDIFMRGRDVATVPIVRVGRSNVYLEVFGRETPFDLEDGLEKSGYGNRGIDPDDLFRINEHLVSEARKRSAT